MIQVHTALKDVNGLVKFFVGNNERGHKANNITLACSKNKEACF